MKKVKTNISEIDKPLKRLYKLLKKIEKKTNLKSVNSCSGHAKRGKWITILSKNEEPINIRENKYLSYIDFEFIKKPRNKKISKIVNKNKLIKFFKKRGFSIQTNKPFEIKSRKKEIPYQIRAYRSQKGKTDLQIYKFWDELTYELKELKEKI